MKNLSDLEGKIFAEKILLSVTGRIIPLINTEIFWAKIFPSKSERFSSGNAGLRKLRNTERSFFSSWISEHRTNESNKMISFKLWIIF